VLSQTFWYEGRVSRFHVRFRARGGTFGDDGHFRAVLHVYLQISRWKHYTGTFDVSRLKDTFYRIINLRFVLRTII
jgi:hypothetical protein